MDHSHHMINHSAMATPAPVSVTTHHVHDHGGHAHHASMPDMDMDMGPCSNMTGHMMMTFHGGYCETVLFDSWKINSVGSLIGSIIGIILIAAFYEGLKYYREYLFWRTYNLLQYRTVSAPSEKTESENSGTKIVRPDILSKIHCFQTFLHVIQLVISYFLMLIFMTFNIWLCLAVLIGAAIGYFLFGWKKCVVVDVTEHCH